MIIESQLLRETFESCMIFFHGIFHRCFDFEVPGSQLLFWTGAWEPPLLQTTLRMLHRQLQQHDVLQRCGFDCKVLEPRHGGTEAVEKGYDPGEL